MELRIIFDRLGFPKHSAEVYEALEKIGASSVSAISKKVRAHRPAIYRCLAALEDNKLIARKDFGKRTYYGAEPRARITALFSKAMQGVREVGEAVPAGPQNSMGAIRYFEGSNTIPSIFNDVVEHCGRGDTFYRYTSERDLDAVNSKLPSDYRKRRDGKRLERLVISNPESGKRKRNRLERFIKFLGAQKESFHQNAIELLYGERIAFIDLNSERGFIIENKTLVEFQKTIFLALYKRL